MQPSARSRQPGPATHSKRTCSSMMSRGLSRACTGISPSPTVSSRLDLDPTLHIRIAEACLGQQFIMRCGVVFLWVAVPYRMTWRYSERGYRELHKDAGHVCQNLYLAASAVGCGVCAIAAYDDDDMHGILGIDGVDQFLIYLATVGKTGPAHG